MNIQNNFEESDDYGFFCELENYDTDKVIVESILYRDSFDGYANYKYTNIVIHQYSNMINKIAIFLTIITSLLMWYQFWALHV